MNNIRIKICGITNQEDARIACHYGVDALGFVFYPDSPRYISPQLAKDIIRVLPPFVTAVGLFVNASVAEIERIMQQVPLDLLQFHGDEDGLFCRQFNRPFIKAVRVKKAQDVLNALAEFADARALLFDAYHPEQYGGTGMSFDWDLLPTDIKQAWILAGGLNADNIAEAIIKTNAMAVDVSGGVEEFKGKKSAEKIADFVKGVRYAQLSLS